MFYVEKHKEENSSWSYYKDTDIYFQDISIYPYKSIILRYILIITQDL